MPHTDPNDARDAALHRLSYELHQTASREGSSERTEAVARLLRAMALALALANGSGL